MTTILQAEVSQAQQILLTREEVAELTTSIKKHYAEYKAAIKKLLQEASGFKNVFLHITYEGLGNLHFEVELGPDYTPANKRPCSTYAELMLSHDILYYKSWDDGLTPMAFYENKKWVLADNWPKQTAADHVIQEEIPGTLPF